MSDDVLSMMRAGQWYSCVGKDLEVCRAVARTAVHEHNSLVPADGGSLGPMLRELLPRVGADVFVETPFHCAYGFNIHLSGVVYLNAGCVILDTAPVRIGAGTMRGPGVTVGDGAIVGAGSIVNRDVAADTRVAGNPARPACDTSDRLTRFRRPARRQRSGRW